MVKMARLRRAGSVMRISDSEIPERTTNFNTQRKRRVRIPKVRWIDVVNNDMRKVGGDRDGWRRILEGAKAHLGL